MSRDKAADAAARAYEVFTTTIAKPDGRRALAENPEETFEQAGVKFSDLPATVRALLKDLSYEELRLLHRYRATLEKANLLQEQRSRGGFATVCKF